MSQQTYPVACECGMVHRVTSGSAGSALSCGCGRTVTVPEFSVLRTLVAEEATSPEVELDARSRLGQLPLESECVVCDEPTCESLGITVECERPVERPTIPVSATFALLLFGWAGLLVRAMIAPRMGGTQMYGDHVLFHLPMRVCRACRETLTDPERAEKAVRHTPLYARLLARYPDAVVIPLGGRPGRTYSTRSDLRSHRRRLMWLVGLLFGAVMFSVLMFGYRTEDTWDVDTGRVFVAGWWSFDVVRLTLRPDEGSGTLKTVCGVVMGVIALAGAVLTGWGAARVAGLRYRSDVPEELRTDGG